MNDFPSKITAGLTFSATLTLAEYPAPDWVLSIVIRGPQAIDLTATADGAGHKFEADADTTAEWAAGSYWFSLRATKAGQVIEVSGGQLVIATDLASAEAGYDGRTQNEKALDAIKAVLANRATQDQQKYTINNRELWRTPMADLLKLKAHYMVAVRRERNAKKGVTGFGRNIQVSF